MIPLFCRHNRFTADCPICSRGTVLDSAGRGRREGVTGGRRSSDRRMAPASGERAPRSRVKDPPHGASPYRGRYGSAGPYEREGRAYEVRLERVPGGLRLAEWSPAQLVSRAPVMAARDLVALVEGANQAGALPAGEHDELRAALTVPPHAAGAEGRAPGASPGRSGELREELRVERLGGGRVRLARWILRPGTGWEMLDAPPMLPARRYAEALRDAAGRGLLG